ncbi:Ankyrin repeat and BTB/POZ domain-containing protein 1 [Pleodorina starrii]|uniref:Ankyrin repeat and BTB/POZ domain-containing protein 1 n=1 Tax=Pleodorina starrii TaxID=330485 RepID=A0A9W6F5U3_9CHLO|nr:Ankyrin repeat and BTB/POZ domain-containing protein 1 [Pleodorina starrii]GLC56761.1 Ankyrin repeat and BTB/POZ domain-containing protein 1 [Pleodorina starrii]GLC66916.1 Ankyrin repeat and BTB/POZ domain-containing protein 1 [Pleodorina starrii]
MLRGELALPTRATGLVVRPRRGGIIDGPALSSGSATGAMSAASAAEVALPTPGGCAAGAGVGASASAAFETLVFFSDRIHVLEGGSGARPFALGKQLRLTEAGSRALHRVCDSTPCPTYEPAGAGVLFVEGYAVMRLDGRNRVSLLAGSGADCATTDGTPDAARFSYIRAMAADGYGNVYVAETQTVRKMTLAVDLTAAADAAASAAAGGGGGGGGSSGSTASSRSGSWSDSTASWLTEVDVELRVRSSTGRSGRGEAAVSCTSVTTLPVCTPPRDRWYALVYDTATDSLLAATDTAVFRLPLPLPAAAATTFSDAAEGGPAAALAAAALQLHSPASAPQLLAGNVHIRGHVDGHGAAVRFHSISAMLATGDGGVLIADGTGLRELDVRSGEVRTVLAEGATRGEPACLAVLPQGCLALGGAALHPHALAFFGLGFRTSGALAAAAAPPPPRSGGGVSGRPRLCRELLLAGSSGGGRAMVVVRVGELRLAAHRAVLAAGSDYFLQLLEGPFTESARLGDGAADSALELQLPEADPDAFAALLCYLYTGRLEVPELLLRPAAELAGRLLMADACSELQRRLLALASPDSVVDDLAWAEAHSLGELLEGLAGYYVDNCRRVAAAEGSAEALARLAEASPALAARLLLAVSAFRW